MIPMSNTSTYERFRQGQAQRRSIVRSNSSLLGSIKNFVAAPFARLFSGTANDFDDPSDLSGKRRLVYNEDVDNNDIVEDGPAPAKRMRVQSPDPPSSPRSAGYLDPPGSAFHLDHNSNLSNNPPSRSASISLPFTTLPDSTVHNARSTVSPLRNTFSRNMSIDSIPSNQSRPLSRDISMKSFSSIPVEHSLSTRAGSRDSMPPLTAHHFRLRESLTPQPHHPIGRQPNRDVSEPPPVTALHSNPVFVRGPSQVSEPQTQPVSTLGTLVDSQRNARSPSRQRSLLFGSAKPTVNPQAIAAERTLHELEFYKTPLVPTRIRSRMPSSLGASASSSNITDMFARKHTLILMGDHDRPTKRDKKTKGKGRSKETNETKPYAGTTGIKKRLAKVKAPNHDVKGKSASNEVSIPEQAAVSSPKEAIVPELPVPPPKEKDTFNVAAFPPSTSPAQQSSLRVGRAARSHLSRPIKKFSASYDDEDDKVGDDYKKDLEMLTEAAKKVPTFEIPPGFSFAKELPPMQPAAAAKEPPISMLPFSLTSSAVSPAPSAQTFSGEIDLGSSSSAGSPYGASLGPSCPIEDNGGASNSTVMADAAVKVPNFFATSKTLAPQISASPATSQMPSASGLRSAFAFAPTTVSVAKELVPPPSNEDRKGPEAASSLFDVPAITSPPSFSFSSGGESTPALASFSAPVIDRSKKDESQPLPLSFGPPVIPPPQATSQSSSVSFGGPVGNTTSSVSNAQFSFGTLATTATSAAATGSTVLNATPFSFGAPPSDLTPTSIFGTSHSAHGDANSSNTFLHGASNGTTKPTVSLFGASKETVKLDNPSLFGSSGDNAKTTGLSNFAFGKTSESSTDSHGTPSTLSFGSRSGTTEAGKPTFGASNVSLSSPFSFAAPTSETPEPPKALFGGDSAGMSNSSEATGFTFGSSSAPSTSAGVGSTKSPFTFGSGVSSTNVTSSAPFTFGVTPARPVTPPNQDREVSMEESPTRDVQVNKPAETRPSLGGFPFSSAPVTSTTSSLFGQSNAAPVSSGFPFGQSSDTLNPFSSKPVEAKPFGTSTTQGGNATSSSFSFGRTPENEPPRPSTTGSFSFGTPASSGTSTGPGPTFSFGAPSNNSAHSNPFSAVQGGSTPNSPSTFGPSSSFSFGSTPNTGSSSANPFSFGSQPASPATPSAGIPSSGFGAMSSNSFGPPTSGSGFGAPAPPSSGGSLFTIGAAPSDSNRQIKRLPNRKKR